MPPSGQDKRHAEEFEQLLLPLLDVAYTMAVRLTGNRDEADDLVQETAVKAYRYFHTFQTGTNFRAWLARIMLNSFREDYSRRKREPAIALLEDAPELHTYTQEVCRAGRVPGMNPAAAAIGKLSEEHIQDAMSALPDTYQMVCVLYFAHEMTYPEIAAVMEIPVGTVRSRLHRGRRMLQKALWDLAVAHDLVSAVDGVQVI